LERIFTSSAQYAKLTTVESNWGTCLQAASTGTSKAASSVKAMQMAPRLGSSNTLSQAASDRRTNKNSGENAARLTFQILKRDVRSWRYSSKALSEGLPLQLASLSSAIGITASYGTECTTKLCLVVVLPTTATLIPAISLESSKS